jgi:hypothetical protein
LQGGGHGFESRILHLGNQQISIIFLFPAYLVSAAVAYDATRAGCMSAYPSPSAPLRIGPAYWVTVLCCLLLCLGCARARPPSPGERPEVFLATMRQRMEAGLAILYFSAQVDHYHAQCLRHYPTLQKPLDAGYHAFQRRHAQLYAAARRYVLLPAAFAPFAEPGDRERIDALVDTGIPAQAARVVSNELAEGSAAARYAQCVFFPSDVLAGDYDIATRAPEAVKLIQDAEDALAREGRPRGIS